MLNIQEIKAAVAHDPLPLLTQIYGDTVRPAGNNQFRVGNKDGKKFDTLSGELLGCDFTGDGHNGDCFALWQKHYACTFTEAANGIATLYGVNANASNGTPFIAPPAHRVKKDTALDTRPPQWREIGPQCDAFWRASGTQLIEDTDTRERIATWRGWTPFTLIPLARAGLIGAADFDFWPASIRPQLCATFRVLHPQLTKEEESGKEFWSWQPVQLHARFACSGAAWKDGRPLSWLYVPTMKSLRMEDGGNAPLVIARDGRDPEQPGYGTHCECVIFCAGEWDALTVLLAAWWIDDNGTLTLPPGLAIVGIRGEGRGGTDAYLRHYGHWRPRSVIMLADADKTGLAWFESKDGEPCFAEQLERRGAKVIPRVPHGAKDVNDLYRTGTLGGHHITEMLTAAGFHRKGRPSK